MSHRGHVCPLAKQRFLIQQPLFYNVTVSKCTLSPGIKGSGTRGQCSLIPGSGSVQPVPGWVAGTGGVWTPSRASLSFYRSPSTTGCEGGWQIQEEASRPA